MARNSKRKKPDWMNTPRECSRSVCKKSYWPVKINQRFCSADCKISEWMEQHPRVQIPAVRLPDGRLRITLDIEDPEPHRPGTQRSLLTKNGEPRNDENENEAL